MKTISLWLTALAALVLLVAVTPRPNGDERFKTSLVASEECLDCHEEVQTDVLVFTAHRHSNQVACVDCHVQPEAHIDDPDVGNITRAEGALGADICMTCHVSNIKLPGPGKGHHARSDVYCSDCHSLHEEAFPEPPLLAKATTDQCLDCHQDIAAALKKPYTHNLGHGGMDCASCHNPHGASGSRGFVDRRGITETCTQCHTDKRGPFVFPHMDRMTGDCLDCHQVHGSSNPYQLTRADVAQLCLECHSTQPGNLLGSQPTSSHNLYSPRFRDCLSCHTAVHGSSRSHLLLK